MSGRKIVEHHHALVGSEEFEHHMATDIARSPSDQDRHGNSSISCSIKLARNFLAATISRRCALRDQIASRTLIK
jgi:hypothetical protein